MDEWLSLAAEVGAVVAPAGMNDVTSGTTWWLYAVDRVVLAPPWSARPCGERTSFEVALEAHGRWRPHLRTRRLPAPIVSDATDRRLAELPPAVRAMLLQADSLLQAIALAGPYPSGYLPDMLEHGLTLVRITSSA